MNQEAKDRLGVGQRYGSNRLGNYSALWVPDPSLCLLTLWQYVDGKLTEVACPMFTNWVSLDLKSVLVKKKFIVLTDFDGGLTGIDSVMDIFLF